MPPDGTGGVSPDSSSSFFRLKSIIIQRPAQVIYLQKHKYRLPAALK